MSPGSDQPPATDPHMCPECSSKLVYPRAWEKTGDEQWELLLRCPNCEWEANTVFDSETVERFDEELDRGTRVLESDLKQLVHASMEQEIVRFIAALRADAILPMDF